MQCRADLHLAGHSPALLAFGSDSSVELLSAIVVLLQFTSILKVSTERAARLAGLLLYLLAGIVAMISVSALVLRVEPDTSKLGIGVTIVALTIMPVLSRAKLRWDLRPWLTKAGPSSITTACSKLTSSRQTCQSVSIGR
jgi:uncharacterized membrane protein YfcA